MNVKTHVAFLLLFACYSAPSNAESAADLFKRYDFTLGLGEGTLNEVTTSPATKVCKMKTGNKVRKETSKLAEQHVTISADSEVLSADNPGDKPDSRQFSIQKDYTLNDIHGFTEYLFSGTIYPKRKKLKVVSSLSNLATTDAITSQIGQLINTDDGSDIQYKPKRYKVSAAISDDGNAVKLILVEKMALKIRTKEIDDDTGAIKNCIYNFKSVTRTFQSAPGILAE